ncbi:hypothetical protein ACVW1A_001342 [Bradyrhizobium sp. LB1.3]
MSRQGVFLLMGESNLKRRAHAAVLDGCPWCIYCGGDLPATTVDHVPPIIMFAQRQRPKGLEFGSCEPCNGGTKHADLVAAMLGRSMPDSGTDAGRAEMKSIFSAVNNNIPGLLQEMHIPRELQTAAGWRKQNGGLLRTDGPLQKKFCRSLVALLRGGFQMLTASMVRFPRAFLSTCCRRARCVKESSKYPISSHISGGWRRVTAWQCSSPPFVNRSQ